MDSVSTRDYFAGLMMQTIHSQLEGHAKSVFLGQLCQESKLTPSEQIAKMAYEQADVMLRWSATNEFKP